MIVGLFISAAAILEKHFLVTPVFVVLAYFFIEGINHFDGLVDFGDAVFAPKNRKTEALKDTKIGAGGTAFALVYVLILFQDFTLADVQDIIFSQILAKYSMLVAIIFSKPAWEGMASYMMRFAGKKDILLGSAIVALFMIIDTSIIECLAATLLITFIVVKYSEKNFGGINGDVLGALNCIVFATSLGIRVGILPSVFSLLNIS